MLDVLLENPNCYIMASFDIEIWSSGSDYIIKIWQCPVPHYSIAMNISEALIQTSQLTGSEHKCVCLEPLNVRDQDPERQRVTFFASWSILHLYWEWLEGGLQWLEPSFQFSVLIFTLNIITDSNGGTLGDWMSNKLYCSPANSILSPLFTSSCQNAQF